METSPFHVRRISPEEFGSWEQTLGATFGFDPRPEEAEVWKKRAEFDRYLGAFDGEEMVGTGGALTYEMTVPGGAALSVGGVTAVATRPTHRRRGVLTAVMRRLLADARERGEAVSALWAAESSIYGRFGYGVAIEGCDLTLERPYAALADARTPEGRLRQVSDGEAREMIPAAYARMVAGIPGALARREADWDLYFYDPEHWRDGATAHRYLAYERDGEVAGYALYRQKENWEQGHARNEVRVGDLQALDGEAYRALWGYFLSMDLVATIRAYARPLRDPVSFLLVAPRRMQQLRTDHIWLRFVDVAAALAARRYGVEGELVLEVSDGFLPESGGRFLLKGGPAGAECVRTDREPEVRLSAADLASAYLGDSRLADLAWLGRVQGEAAAVTRAHLMFSWPVAPWCTVHF
ncbi:MAG: GNAT family N-acetyltransferase [Acidimicrobiia bacterium]|nr:GNAT family N-acetyltransferase [Acidimicrobiia bacterium]